MLLVLLSPSEAATQGLWDNLNCVQSLPQGIALTSVAACLGSDRLYLFT